MARLKIFSSVLALTLATGTSLAQENTRTVQVVDPGQKIEQSVVRAQFIRPGDVSPEEYSRLLAEADRIRSYQAVNGSLAAPVTYNAASSASVNELAPQPYSQYQAQQVQNNQSPRYTVPNPTYVTPQSPAATYTQGQTYYPTVSQPAYQPYYGVTQPSTPAPTYQAPVYASPQNTATYTTATSTPANVPVTTYSTPIAAHNVMKGDTLYNISKRYGVSLNHLRGANRLTGNNIRLGQILTIPSVQKTVATQYAPQAPTNFQTVRATQTYAPTQARGTTYVRNVKELPRSGVYAVLPKDTLYSISRFACVSPADVAQINGISNAATLQPGQKLTMPAGHCLN